MTNAVTIESYPSVVKFFPTKDQKITIKGCLKHLSSVLVLTEKARFCGDFSFSPPKVIFSGKGTMSPLKVAFNCNFNWPLVAIFVAIEDNLLVATFIVAIENSRHQRWFLVAIFVATKKRLKYVSTWCSRGSCWLADVVLAWRFNCWKCL